MKIDLGELFRFVAEIFLMLIYILFVVVLPIAIAVCGLVHIFQCVLWPLVFGGS